MVRKTTVAIDGENFLINGRAINEGRTWRGHNIEGLLLNSRMVQGIFDDLNPDTRSGFDYPDGPWDAARNTREFIEAMPDWAACGLGGFTINLQGGNPEGYGADQPWHNSAFESDGSLRDDYLGRMAAILDKADELGMVAIVGYFYFGQDQRLADEQAVISAIENTTDWLVGKQYSNVLVEVCNETDVPRYEHEILTPDRVCELVELVRVRSEGKLLVSVSMSGGKVPPSHIVEAVDFVLMHGNGVEDPNRIRQMVNQCRASDAYPGQPIVFNEDDHFGFDQQDCNFAAAVSSRAGWGYFDRREAGEGYDEGYQSVPVNWRISSARKKGFYGMVAEMTGSRLPE